MKEFQLKNLQPSSFFTKTLFLDKAFVITAPEMALTDEIIGILKKWSFDSVFSEGEPHSEYTGGATDAKAGDSGQAGLFQQSDTDKLEKAEEFYRGLLYYAENTFVRAAVSDELDFNAINEKIRVIIDFLKENRRFLMRVLKITEPAPDKSYIATHSVRSTIISLIIGTHLKLPNHRLLELGVAAFTHEIGMLKLPSQIYLSQRQLTPQEQRTVITHTILGFNLLKSLKFPIPVCLAALEHHERENASGYPRRLTGDKIGLFSKIIAVACSYEALSSKRPHKEAKDGYTGMIELLKNEGKQYDDTVIKALVVSQSIYPIGLYVLLSNGKKGQVIDVTPETPRFPIVQVFGEFTPDGKTKTVQTAANELTIVRPLNKSEIET